MNLLFSLSSMKRIFFSLRKAVSGIGLGNKVTFSAVLWHRGGVWRVCEQSLIHHLPQILILLLLINSVLSLLLTPRSSELPALFPQTFGMHSHGSSSLLPSRPAEETQRNASAGSELGRGGKRSGNVMVIHGERVTAGWELSPAAPCLHAGSS